MAEKSLVQGVVTFLDVLAWKGVYHRMANPIDDLTRLVEGLETEAKKQRGLVTAEVIIKSISDTIAIFTYCTESEVTKAIEIHGALCRWIIPESIAFEIPVRGAISVGEFMTKDNIFVGKAVDEAAAWHEHADWIGVHLTPSAEYVFAPTKSGEDWKAYSPPTKTRFEWIPHCVNWTAKWTDRAREVQKIKDKFRRLGPIVPEIAGKFINTLAFIEEVGKPTKFKSESL